MADAYVSDQSIAVVDVLQIPTVPVTRVFQFLLCFANIACWMSILPVSLILLPTQVAALDPVHKFSNLALISSAGALAALITNPLAGALSDRTQLRWGRRRPWLLAGTLCSAFALALMAYATSFLVLLLTWVVFHIAINVLLAALTAVVPDKVPARQRATVSALVSLALPLGGVIGSLTITKLGSAVTTAYFFLIGVLIVAMALFLLVLRERPLAKDSIPPFSLRIVFTSFWINPIKNPNFAWAWLTRFLVYLSYYVALGYLLYFLHDVVHYTRIYPHQTDAQGVTSFQTVLTATLIVASLCAGFFSDRFQRRKIFVIASSMVIVCSFLILVFSQSWAAVLLSSAVLGLGFGAYLGVDIALIIQVLPLARDHGKDMGVINIANTLPQVLGPTVAAVVITLFHNYTILFLVAAGLACLGGILVQAIKGVS